MNKSKIDAYICIKKSFSKSIKIFNVIFRGIRLGTVYCRQLQYTYTYQYIL